MGTGIVDLSQLMLNALFELCKLQPFNVNGRVDVFPFRDEQYVFFSCHGVSLGMMVVVVVVGIAKVVKQVLSRPSGHYFVYAKLNVVY